MVALVFLATGCNRIRTSKDYYLYTYDDIVGNFVQSNAKITFDKDIYTMYNNAGRVTNIGEHSTNNNYVSFVPINIGANNNPLTQVTTFYVYKSYLIPTNQIISRVSETNYEDKSDLEGIYDAGFKLRKEKVYVSIDGSGTNASYIEEVGSYESNRRKDFINFTAADGSVEILLVFEYQDAFGNDVKALAPIFYSYKTPRTRDIKVSALELKDKVFINKSVDGGSAEYELSLLSYPSKGTINKDVKYSIVGVNPNATISGSTLTFTGTGLVQIEYEYGKAKSSEWVYIVDLELKNNLTDGQRTFAVGSFADYDDIILQVANYSNYGFTFESVVIKDSDKAKASNGEVAFLQEGNVNVDLIVRHVQNFKDGSTKVVEKTVSLILIIA